MVQLTEIRWHGRGGQGAKTAALLLADAAFYTGKYIQGFPEYGPERMGAPITAYNRISSHPIRIHSNIYEPDFVAVIDETLLGSVDVTAGLKEEGALVINSADSPEMIRAQMEDYQGKVYVINARQISEETMGVNIPNTPMLAAMVKVSGVMGEEQFLEKMAVSLAHKFSAKPEVIEGNLRALERGMKEVVEA